MSDTSTQQLDDTEQQQLTPEQQELKKVEDTFYPPKEEEEAKPSEPEKAPETKESEEADKSKESGEVKKDGELKLTLPEGAVIDEGDVQRISTYAKEKGLTNEQAQDLVHFENDAVKRFIDSQQQTFKEQKDSWKANALDDKEIGGDKFMENVALSNRVIKRFASEALIEELEKTGLGDYPELVRVFARIGKAMGEDRLVTGGLSVPAPKSMEEVFYGSKT